MNGQVIFLGCFQLAAAAAAASLEASAKWQKWPRSPRLSKLGLYFVLRGRKDKVFF